MRKAALLAPAVLVISLASHLGAQKHTLAEQPLLLVANQGDHTLSLIDPASAHQIAAVPVGGITGHEVVASPDGKTAYVPIYGNSGVGRPGTDGDRMAVIDLASQKLTGFLEFGHGVRPRCVRYDANTGKLLVTTELDKTVTIVDPRTLKITGTIPTTQIESHMLVLTRDGRRGYTANVGAQRVRARHSGAQNRRRHPNLR